MLCDRVLNFDGAVGSLISDPNKGLEAMFTVYGIPARLALHPGIATPKRRFRARCPTQGGARSMRALSGKKEPFDRDALIWHADVRRMLLTRKPLPKGGRAMIYAAAQTADLLFNAVLENDPATREQYDHRLGFYTPSSKAF